MSVHPARYERSPRRAATSAALAILLVCATANCLSAQTLPFTILEDNFTDGSGSWQPYYIGSAGGGGCFNVTNDNLVLSLAGNGVYGVYHPTNFGGNFDVRVDLDFGRNAGNGIMLIKEDGGNPDANNYIGLEGCFSNGCPGVVAVRAVKDGADLIPSFQYWNAKYDYALTNDAHGYSTGALRILKDSPADCLHFYYKYEREIDGEVCEGWMEFSTLPDWGVDSFFIYLFVRSDGKAVSSNAVSHALVRQTLADEPPETNAVFRATRRDYTFSGVAGDAVVVTFDDECSAGSGARFVFWSQANYQPWWHIDETCAVSYEFCETWGGGTEGCCEPMSDRLLRWSEVEILETSSVRVVVHWRYVLCDCEYRWWGLSPTEKPWADEWFYLYPDGTGVRKLTYSPSLNSGYNLNWNEISEPMVITRGGHKPSEFLRHGAESALTMMNVQGNKLDFYWDLTTTNWDPMPDSTKYWHEAICRVNLRGDRPAVFEVFAQGPTYAETFPQPYWDWWANYGQDGWAFRVRGSYEFAGDFCTFAHWPISKQPYNQPCKTIGKYIREPSHTSLLPVPGHSGHGVDGPITWAMLVGIADPDDDQVLKEKTTAWLYPGDVTMRNAGSHFVETDYHERAIVFDNNAGNQRCCFTIDPSTESSTMVNPVFKITGWGDHPVVIHQDGITLEGNRDYRYAILNADTALIWVKTEFASATTFWIADTELGPAVQADFRAAPLAPLDGAPVYFTDLSAGAPDCWSWDFDGDGTVDSPLQHPTNTYPLPGEYSVTLAVINHIDGGVWSADTLAKTNYVNVVPEVGAVLTACGLGIALFGARARAPPRARR